jgi:hypothetical protein
MLALRSIYAAVIQVQTSSGNPFPQVVGCIAVMGVSLAPAITLALKYLPEVAYDAAIALAVAASLCLALAVALATPGKIEKAYVPYSVRFRIASAIFVPALSFALIGRTQPELAALLFLAFCAVPLQRVLRLPARGTASEP